MGGTGPAPKPNHRHRIADVYSDIQKTVIDDGELQGPALEGFWSDSLRGWYDIWRRSPQAKTFVMTDWMRLRMLAPLVEDYLKKPTAMKMAEIRQSESLLGCTYIDRLKGRIRVVKPEDEAPVVSITASVVDEYRHALGA